MSTDLYVRRSVILSTHKALLEVFGQNYSTRCLQSSIVIQNLLSSLGIKSEIHAGFACFGRALAEEKDAVGWTGFWGKETHAWAVTEFREIIDLTVSQLHEHPKSETKDEPVPIIWYGPYDKLPMVINYRPYGRAQWELPPEEIEEIEKCKYLALSHLEGYLSNPEVQDELPAPILTGPVSLQKMHEDGNRWLNKCIVLQHIGMPLPEKFK